MGSAAIAVAFMLSAAVVLSIAGVTPSFAQESSEIADERLVFLLSTYHGEPTLEQLQDVGDDEAVAARLRELAGEVDARPSMRLRAVDALGHYSDTATVEFLERVVQAPSHLEVRHSQHAALLRQHAMLSFARIRGEAAVATIAPFTHAANLQLKLTAISALGRFGGQAGLAELERLRADIAHPAVRRSLNKFAAPASNK